MWAKRLPKNAKITLQITHIAQKRLCLSFLIMIIQKLHIGLKLKKIVLQVFKNSSQNILIYEI